jgi:protein TonB
MGRRLQRGAVWYLAFALAASFTTAQTEPDETVYELGPGITPPRVTKQVSPQYAGRGVRVVGSVTVGLVVTSRGLPQNVQVIKSLEKDVDQSAVDAVKQWRFDPGKKDGKPVAVRIALELDFHSM